MTLRPPGWGILQKLLNVSRSFLAVTRLDPGPSEPGPGSTAHTKNHPTRPASARSQMLSSTANLPLEKKKTPPRPPGCHSSTLLSHQTSKALPGRLLPGTDI